MRGLIAVALVVAGVALPACAQRGGGGRGAAAGRSSGFANRSAPAFHASLSPSVRLNSVGPLRFRSSRYFATYREPGMSARRQGTDRRPDYRDERGYRSFYDTGLAYAGAINPGCFSFGDCGPDENASNYAPAAAQDLNSSANAQGLGAYAGQGAAEDRQANASSAPFRPPYERPMPPPEPEQAVTLVFKDGRPPEQVHNYMLTRTTLYVQDERRREIAVADLDLAATEKVNKDSGVAFQLPGTQSGL